ncbi:MAG: ChbG/HpnK family deacetylase, partial [Sporomusaceae bacterium]|nr:ChbG/HpnK family deacetylase [Sporomusaceae bacterium]
EAFAEAAEMAGKLPKLGVGVHLTLVGEKPVENPARVPSLLNGGVCFYDNYTQFIKKYAQGKIDHQEIAREFRAQIEKAQKLKITHLDSHQHLHVLPGIIELVIELALEFGIKAVRVPGESFFFRGGYQAGLGRFIGRSGLTALALNARRKIKKAALLAPDNFFGMLAGGNLREEFLLNILAAVPAGVSEIMIHPAADDRALQVKYGWAHNWQAELSALTSEKVLWEIKKQKIELISFGNL